MENHLHKTNVRLTSRLTLLVDHRQINLLEIGSMDRFRFKIKAKSFLMGKLKKYWDKAKLQCYLNHSMYKQCQSQVRETIFRNVRIMKYTLKRRKMVALTNDSSIIL